MHKARDAFVFIVRRFVFRLYKRIGRILKRKSYILNGFTASEPLAFVARSGIRHLVAEWFLGRLEVVCSRNGLDLVRLQQ